MNKKHPANRAERMKINAEKKSKRNEGKSIERVLDQSDEAFRPLSKERRDNV
jgi:hypothetical protein